MSDRINTIHPIFDPEVERKLRKTFVPGVSREYSEEEKEMMRNTLFGKEFDEFDKNNKHGQVEEEE